MLTTSYLGLGLGLGLLYIYRSQTLKPFSTAIKVAEGALKGTKGLHKLHSPRHALLFASKAIIKGYNASIRLNLIKATTQNPLLDMKRVKAFVGAVNLVRYAHLPPSGSGFVEYGLLRIWYKLSKNLLWVLEGFMGIQLDSAVKTGVEALGLFFKTVFVSREFSQIVNLGLSRTVSGGFKRVHETESDGNCYLPVRNCYLPVRTGNSRCKSCLKFERTDWNPCCCECGYLRSSALDFPSYEKVLIAEKSLESCISDLLCLSLPVDEKILHHLL